jgi:hypothetical protein
MLPPTKEKTMPKYEFDAKLFTTITVTAKDEATAEKEAKDILDRMTLQDPKNPDVDYGVDTEDGVMLVDEIDEETS